MKQENNRKGHIEVRDVLYDPRYMWVATDDEKGGAPVLAFRTAEEAADALLGTEGIWLRPVAVFERFKAGMSQMTVEENVSEYVWVAVSKEAEDPLILFETIQEAAFYVLDDQARTLKPLKVLRGGAL